MFDCINQGEWAEVAREEYQVKVPSVSVTTKQDKGGKGLKTSAAASVGGRKSAVPKAVVAEEHSPFW